MSESKIKSIYFEKMNQIESEISEENHTEKLQFKNVLSTLLSRLALIGLISYYTIYIACATNSKEYYCLFVFSFIISIDTAYVVIKRKGFDFGW